MYKTRISKDDPEMLRQQIIHYKAEISRYKKLLEEYQENYYYNLIDELRKENERLNHLVHQLQTATEEKEERTRKENAEQQLKLIRDKSIEQLREMKEENDRLKKELSELQSIIKQFEQDSQLEQQVREEGAQDSDWFMRTLRERNSQQNTNEDH